jgi:carbon storage regulator
VLVLSRKTGQRISIGDSIEITVVEVCDHQVRLGIDAPRSVPVYRKELLEQVRAANVEAVKTAPPNDSDSGGQPVEAQIKKV